MEPASTLEIMVACVVVLLVVAWLYLDQGWWK